MAELDSLLEALESRLSRGGENITEEFSFREERREWSERTTTTTTRHRETRELPVKPRIDDKMATMAISNNINELDILLQDLSAARYSGHVETLESSVTQSRSFALGLGSDQGPGKGPGLLGHFSASQSQQPGLSHDVHAAERSEGRGSGEQSREQSEDRWEYRGQGIWETRDMETGGTGEIKR